MVWRLSRKDWIAGKGAANRERLHQLVASGATPGVLAYAGDAAVGWCAVAPRDAYPALARSRVLGPVDDRPVWSVSCLFVARSWRRRGLSSKLLQAAVALARDRGATEVEGYPFEPSSQEDPAPFIWTGTPSTYLRAGFVEVARRSPRRPIMRYAIAERERG
jgi:GNAT superfamily N-acetyltransferase